MRWRCPCRRVGSTVRPSGTRWHRIRICSGLLLLLCCCCLLRFARLGILRRKLPIQRGVQVGIVVVFSFSIGFPALVVLVAVVEDLPAGQRGVVGDAKKLHAARGRVPSAHGNIQGNCRGAPALAMLFFTLRAFSPSNSDDLRLCGCAGASVRRSRRPRIPRFPSASVVPLPFVRVLAGKGGTLASDNAPPTLGPCGVDFAGNGPGHAGSGVHFAPLRFRFSRGHGELVVAHAFHESLGPVGVSACRSSIELCPKSLRRL